MRNQRKAQASVDYLSTYIYGAIAIIAVIGSLAYFGAFSQDDFVKESCESGEQLACGDVAATTNGEFRVSLRNNLERDITIDNAVLSFGEHVVTATHPIIIPAKGTREVMFDTGVAFEKDNKETFDYNLTYQPTGSPNHYIVNGHALVKITHVAEPECGNYRREGDEECDTDVTNACSALDGGQTYVLGNIRCTDCHLDYSQCEELDENNCGTLGGIWRPGGWDTDGWNSNPSVTVRCCKDPLFLKMEHLNLYDITRPATGDLFYWNAQGCCDSAGACSFNGSCYEADDTLTLEVASGTHTFTCGDPVGGSGTYGEWACEPYTQTECDTIAPDDACGNYYDNCDNTVFCDRCPANTACMMNGNVGDCVTSCLDASHYTSPPYEYECGTWTDNCGGDIFLGDCTAPDHTCNAMGRCEQNCYDEAYYRDTLDYECGYVSDPNNCGGHTITLGDCPAGICDQGSHTCCEPQTCYELGYECGTHDDGCGGQIVCDACPSGLCNQTTYMCSVETEDIEGAYTFDDPGDDTGNHDEFDITSGSIDDGAGRDGGPALVLDGDDSHVDIGTWSIEGYHMTIAAWVWLDYYPPAEDPRILSKGFSRNYQNWALLVQRERDPEFRIGGPSGTYPPQDLNRVNPDSQYAWRDTSIDWTVNPRTWYHLAGTYDGNRLRLYFNGELVAWNGYSGAIRVDDNPVWIGGQPTDATEREWPGIIDELYILNTTLNDDQIRNLYTSMLP